MEIRYAVGALLVAASGVLVAGPAQAAPTGPGMVKCPPATQTVGTASQLRTALAKARPGDVIKLRPGLYRGNFVAQKSGTQSRPIFVCGTAGSVIEGGGPKGGYGFHINKGNYWRLIGFTVRKSQKGVMADRTRGSVIQSLTVHSIGDEAIHLRDFSTKNIVQYNRIYNTGLRKPQFGEGVYIGTAESNWKKYTGGRMDRSDGNWVRGNEIKSTAEAIDVKEGTSGGWIVGNVFDGSALVNDGTNDSWVDVKGNGYVIENNRGRRTPLDGFQTHEIVDGWGTGNVFRRNVINLSGAKGVGINDTVGGNTITCDNKVTGGPLLKKGACS